MGANLASLRDTLPEIRARTSRAAAMRLIPAILSVGNEDLGRERERDIGDEREKEGYGMPRRWSEVRYL